MAGPLLKIKAGSVTATVWNNTRKINGKDVDVKSVRIERNYQDRQGKWVGTPTFQTRDLPKVILVAQEAYKALTLKPESTAESE